MSVTEVSSDLPQDLYGQIDPPQRLLMGPGPVNAHPRVLRAMSADMLGQFDPEMTGYMNQVMALYRPVFGTANPWTMLVDGTARAGIEAALVSLIAPGDRALVVNFGRFGLLLQEILTRIGAAMKRWTHPGARWCRWRPSPRPRAGCSRTSSAPCMAIRPPPWRSLWMASGPLRARSARWSMSTPPPPSAAWRLPATAGAPMW
jgi:(S)-ureidoglycine-glyoxylate aminotransferase